MKQKIKNFYHLLMAFLASVYYGFPGSKLKIIGITGTDGKTTTACLTYHILKEAGKKVSMISTIYASIGNKVYETGLHTTTPGVWDIQKYLKMAVDNKDEYFVIETTSHALDQNRVWGIPYYIGLITNITHEHLDYHKSYLNLVRTKASLLKSSAIKIVNLDDGSFSFLKNYFNDLLTYSIENKEADFFYSKKIKSNLVGEFNKFNVLAAFAICKKLNLDESKILDGIWSFKNPTGRMEIVYDRKFQIIIDFAHTPNSINSALKAVKTDFLNNKGRLIHVFGSAGLRDDKKRPFMGSASAKNSDLIILTEEDYRTENIDEINEQISKGIFKNGFNFVMPQIFKKENKTGTYTIIKDRQRAIDLAVEIARTNDVIVITGKGHEKSLCRGKKECEWSEFLAVKKAIKSNNL